MIAEQAYLFRHALLRDAAYQLQLPADRARLHGLAAALLEDLVASRTLDASGTNLQGEIARHLRQYREISNDNSRVEAEIRHCELAAEQAERLYDNREALQMWLGAAEIGPPVVRARALLRAVGLALTMGLAPEAWNFAKAALAAAEAGSSAELVAAAHCAWGQCAQYSGDVETAAKALQTALELVPPECGKLRAEILGELAWLHDDQGSLELARQEYEEAIKVCRSLHDPVGEGKMLCNLATLHRLASRHELAQDLYRRSLVLFRSARARKFEGVAESGLGASVAMTDGEDEAARHEERALEIFQEVGAKSHEGIALANLSVRLNRQSEMEQRLELCSRALALQLESGNRYGTAAAMRAMADTLRRLRRLDEAGALLRDALAIHQSMKDPRNEAQTHYFLAKLLSTHDRDSANRHFEAAIACAESIHDQAVLSDVYLSLGTRHLHDDQLAEARHWLELSLDRASLAGLAERQAGARANLGEVLRREGRLQESLDSIQQALSIYERLGYENEHASCQCGLALTLLQMGRHAEAGDCWKRGIGALRQLAEESEMERHRVEMMRLCAHLGVEPLKDA